MKRICVLAMVCGLAVLNVASAETIRGIDIDFVTIVNAGNIGDTRANYDGYNGYTTGYGAVGYNYRIGKYEITNAQWNAFTALAGVPTGNPSNAYHQSAYWTGNQQPTTNVSWYEAAQFCNYLTSGNKSLGAYQLGTDGSYIINRAAAISAYGTIYVLPTENEWYKAAYYKPNGSGYSTYANGLDVIPAADNGWNYDGGAYSTPWNVGTGTQEQNGTFDLTGNVWEWNETRIYGSISPDLRGLRGGSFGNPDSGSLSSSLRNSCNTYFQGDDLGFRVASIPAPAIPPVADAGSDQTVMDTDDNCSEEVNLNGSGSSDSDGTIVSWVWTDSLGDIIPDGEITTATLSVGTHTITLAVTDDDGLTDTDTVTVTIEPYPNQPPVADANGPYTIYVGGTLTLNASGSTDEHNNIVSYLWDLDDSNSFETDAGSNAVFDVNYTCLQTLGLLVGNTYKIHLKVTDSGGLSNVASTTLTIIPAPALQVFVDIKPGGCPNPLNVKSSGVLPAAILGTADFDVTTIDTTSIRLAGVSPLRSSIEDVAGPAADSNDCNCTEDGPDGFLDLTLKFKTQDIVEAIGDVNYGDTLTLRLTGMMTGERPIMGTDCILIVGKHKPLNKADINKDGVVNSQDFAIFTENWLKSSIVED